jgi:predicted flavoprotein YhiN
MHAPPKTVMIFGAGPAGLMAGEHLARAGIRVVIVEKMPTIGRKLQMAGRGGLNLSHSEGLWAGPRGQLKAQNQPYKPAIAPLIDSKPGQLPVPGEFLARYGPFAKHIAPWLAHFDVEALCRWCDGLGIETFIGSSGRIFPKTLKSSPLLRAWLKRLREMGVEFRLGVGWKGFIPSQGGAPLSKTPFTAVVETPNGQEYWPADGYILAFGGASWPRLGSDGSWALALSQAGVACLPFAPSNCGFVLDMALSPALQQKILALPLKNIALTFAGQTYRGELMITQLERGKINTSPKLRSELNLQVNPQLNPGARREDYLNISAKLAIEGGPIYALSPLLRHSLQEQGPVTLRMDCRPDLSQAALKERFTAQRGALSLSSRLAKLNLSPAISVLLYEALALQAKQGDEPLSALTKRLAVSPGDLAALLKALPVRLAAPMPLERAISSSGGVSFTAVDGALMVKALPGVFVAGEMLDWEAPTGGYLLQACLACGVFVSKGMLDWLKLESGKS